MMNDEDLWIMTYMLAMWKNNDSVIAKKQADKALADFRKKFKKD
jgi:hypothetical protein